jgi:hypothetical protein
MKIDVNLQAGPHGAGLARRQLEALEREIPAGVYTAVRLLVSELIANSPAHPSVRPEGWIRVTVETSSQGVRAVVKTLSGASTRRAKTESEEELSTWDLILLSRMADRWGILEGSGGDVWFELDSSASSTD